MDKLIFLGTGHAVAIHGYATSIALCNDDHLFLTDAGGGSGILLQLEKAGISYDQLTDIFVSHVHTDHILGVIWLIRMVGHSFGMGSRTKPLTLYGHADVLGALRRVCNELQSPRILSLFDENILFRPVENGEVCTIGSWPITFFDTGATKTRQYGWTATLTNGERLSFLGDEPLYEASVPFVQNVDHLIHEAFCTSVDEAHYNPHRISHSTVVDAAKNATNVGARHLILFHGEDKNLDTRKARYIADARPYFSGPIDAPDDLDIIPLNLEETHA